MIFILLKLFSDFVDKRGRKVKDTANEDLSIFYNLSDQDGTVVHVFFNLFRF